VASKAAGAIDLSSPAGLISHALNVGFSNNDEFQQIEKDAASLKTPEQVASYVKQKRGEGRSAVPIYKVSHVESFRSAFRRAYPEQYQIDRLDYYSKLGRQHDELTDSDDAPVTEAVALEILRMELGVESGPELEKLKNDVKGLKNKGDIRNYLCKIPSFKYTALMGRERRKIPNNLGLDAMLKEMEEYMQRLIVNAKKFHPIVTYWQCRQPASAKPNIAFQQLVERQKNLALPDFAAQYRENLLQIDKDYREDLKKIEEHMAKLKEIEESGNEALLNSMEPSLEEFMRKVQEQARESTNLQVSKLTQKATEERDAAVRRRDPLNFLL